MFLTIGLGTVTAVLTVGVLVGQLDINVGGPLKSVSFRFDLNPGQAAGMMAGASTASPDTK